MDPTTRQETIALQEYLRSKIDHYIIINTIFTDVYNWYVENPTTDRLTRMVKVFLALLRAETATIVRSYEELKRRAFRDALKSEREAICARAHAQRFAGQAQQFNDHITGINNRPELREM